MTDPSGLTEKLKDCLLELWQARNAENAENIQGPSTSSPSMSAFTTPNLNGQMSAITSISDIAGPSTISPLISAFGDVPLGQHHALGQNVAAQQLPQPDKETKWFLKKPMLKFLLTLLSQPNKYQKYIKWVLPYHRNFSPEQFKTYTTDEQFGIFTISDKLSLAVLWATIREKKIVSSVKDGFLRNLRLYYVKRNRKRCDKRSTKDDDNGHQAIISPVKRLKNKETGQMEKVSDTWQFIDRETLVSFFEDLENEK